MRYAACLILADLQALADGEKAKIFGAATKARKMESELTGCARGAINFGSDLLNMFSFPVPLCILDGMSGLRVP
jgi:hypothetical protein